MFNGLKARRRLAVYVALGLSAGSCTFLDASTVYAADYKVESGTFYGLEGTDKTHSMSGNNITLGKVSGPTNTPQNLWGTISGGGKKTTASDVSNNTLTIHGLRSANGGGQSFIYGGVSDAGAVTGNKVIFNNGYSADAVIGGYSNTTTKDVRDNTVEIKAGTIQEDIIGGWAGAASGTGTLSGNKVIISGGTIGSYSDGIVYGARTGGKGLLTDNSVSFSGATTSKSVYGAAADSAASSAKITHNTLTVSGGTIAGIAVGGYTKGSGELNENTVTVSGGTVTSNFTAGGYADQNTTGAVSSNHANISGGTVKNLVGGMSFGSGNVTGNTVTISGGTATMLIGGYSTGVGNATGNTVTVTGGTVTGKIIGGNAAGTGAATGNTINLGEGSSATLATGTNLAAATVLGGNKPDLTGNKLNVKAKSVKIKTAANFAEYNFFLSSGIANNDTLLTFADAGSFGGGTNAEAFSKIKLDSTSFDAWKASHANEEYSVTLLKGQSSNALRFTDYSARLIGTEGNIETGIRTDTNEAQAKSVLLSAHQFRNKTDRLYNAPNPASGAEVYGGISYYGNTTYNNTLTVNAVTGAIGAAYGGITRGTAGDSKENTVNVDLESGGIQAVFGGAVQNENNAGVVTGNKVNITKGTFQNVYSGYTIGEGAVQKNITTITDGTFTQVEGGYIENNASTADVTENETHFNGGTADVVRAGVSNGSGAATKNKTFFHGGTAQYVQGARSGGEVSENEVTITGGTITNTVFGGLTAGGAIRRTTSSTSATARAARSRRAATCRRQKSTAAT